MKHIETTNQLTVQMQRHYETIWGSKKAQHNARYSQILAIQKHCVSPLCEVTHTQLTTVPIGGLWLQVVWANEDHSWNDFQDATVLVTVKRPAPRQKNRMRNNQSPQIQTEAHKT